MLQVTKIFHFEMAHAIAGYNGPCKNIHGHSYELHVAVLPAGADDNYIPAPGFIFDFKQLKKIVTSVIIEKLDHKLVLSKTFVEKNNTIPVKENLFILGAEPTAENLLIYIRDSLKSHLPEGILLYALKIYETNSSYAEWINRAI